MLGMMQKDLCLLLQRSRAMITIVGVGILIGFSTDGSFMIGYLSMISAVLAIGTISYDEFDNGYPFLLTLPITRKGYVLAKYLFCLLFSLAGWCIALVIYALVNVIRGGQPGISLLTDGLAFLPVAILVTALMLPLQLKYGAEKSRVMLAVFVGGAVALGYLGMKLFPASHGLLEALEHLSGAAAGVVLALVLLAALALSCRISIRIMEKKEL